MSRLGQGSDTTACPWCEGNIDPSGGYFSKLDDNHKSHNSQGFTIFSQFSRSPGRLLNHEWARKESRGLLNHEWTRMDQTTKHTKHTKKTQNHEWTRMDQTTKHTKHTKKTQNHEWTRMGTKVGSREKKGEGSAWMARLGASIEKERTTNGHEYLWSGGYYPRSHVGCPQLWTGCNAPSPHSSPICQVGNRVTVSGY